MAKKVVTKKLKCGRRDGQVLYLATRVDIPDVLGVGSTKLLAFEDLKRQEAKTLPKGLKAPDFLPADW